MGGGGGVERYGERKRGRKGDRERGRERDQLSVSAHHPDPYVIELFYTYCMDKLKNNCNLNYLFNINDMTEFLEVYVCIFW